MYNLILNPPKKEGICDKCDSELITRKDDNLETVQSRLDQYFKATSPLVDYYEKEGILYTAVVSKTVGKMEIRFIFFRKFHLFGVMMI